MKQNSFVMLNTCGGNKINNKLQFLRTWHVNNKLRTWHVN